MALAQQQQMGGGQVTYVVVEDDQEVNHCQHCLLFWLFGGFWLPFWLAACFCGVCKKPCG